MGHSSLGRGGGGGWVSGDRIPDPRVTGTMSPRGLRVSAPETGASTLAGMGILQFSAGGSILSIP